MSSLFPPARFQSFDDASDSSQSASRIAALRASLEKEGLAGFVVPRSDEHQSEYVPANAERLAWLTGFTGSAGNAVILMDKAALVIDGRYTLQAAQQVDQNVVIPVPLAEMTAEDWIALSLPAGGKLGYDPWLHTDNSVKSLKAAVMKAGGTLVALDFNPIDRLWQGRPSAPKAPVYPHPLDYAGEETASKLNRIRSKLVEARIDSLIVSDPHNMAWAFNLRGGDVPHTPLPLGYAVIPVEGEAQIFIDPAKMTEDAAMAVGAYASIEVPANLVAILEQLGAAKARLRIDNATGAAALGQRIEAAGGIADVGPDPISLMKAVKNSTEIAGSRAAHKRDGVAVTRFLHWLAENAPTGNLTEIDTVNALEAFRAESSCLKDISFASISGVGPHAALPHYRVSRDSDMKLTPGEIYLIDSGAQYEDGTTDITRTVIIGKPTEEMRDRFTRVLKGHIAIAQAVFPKGTSGAQIDMLARQPLWNAGLDFDHGTGHGIGSYLSVHEGPQRLAKTGVTPLEPGMLLSNEPGYYKVGSFGIRIENLILVEERQIKGAERTMLGFETLSFAPIDLTLVEPSLLTADEKAWLNAYHARVRQLIGPELDDKTRAWLTEVTADI